MRYKDNVSRSAELLRLAVPLMSKQEAGMHPVSYALWYEYVSGMNAALQAELDALMRTGTKLTEELTLALHNKHIVDSYGETTERVSGELGRVLSEVLSSTASTGGHAETFAATLERLSANLKPAPSDLQENVAMLLRNSNEIKSSLLNLKQVLHESRTEVEHLRAELQQAREEALVDSLTGLVNRKGFDQSIATLVRTAQLQSTPLCLALIDIDHFKRVNDTYGHLFGDRVIRVVAQALKTSVKGKDTMARYGGEEFAMLLPETSISGGVSVAEQLRKLVERSRIRRLDNESTVGQITVSVGIALYAGEETVTEFLGRADAALYQSKESGRNRVTVAGGLRNA